LRWQTERHALEFRPRQRYCSGFSFNPRILLANSKPLSFSTLIFGSAQNGFTESLNSSGGDTDKAFYDKVF
jgi:hypothetical protein